MAKSPEKDGQIMDVSPSPHLVNNDIRMQGSAGMKKQSGFTLLKEEGRERSAC